MHARAHARAVPVAAGEKGEATAVCVQGCRAVSPLPHFNMAREGLEPLGSDLEGC